MGGGLIEVLEFGELIDGLLMPESVASGTLAIVFWSPLLEPMHFWRYDMDWGSFRSRGFWFCRAKESRLRQRSLIFLREGRARPLAIFTGGGPSPLEASDGVLGELAHPSQMHREPGADENQEAPTRRLIDERFGPPVVNT